MNTDEKMKKVIAYFKNNKNFKREIEVERYIITNNYIYISMCCSYAGSEFEIYASLSSDEIINELLVRIYDSLKNMKKDITDLMKIVDKEMKS